MTANIFYMSNKMDTLYPGRLHLHGYIEYLVSISGA